ncbi:hypothetical protein LPUS_03083 [Lasallia pustulata]|uniref:YAG7-like dimerisation domain-containing protein n=1 Tax=Lasallia pustulata TaxID=136370 RepID=A0A1W5CTV6_9LECA|nr:hypothetical protein LPUS_03083 [Lasallia pustulata]
MSAPTTSNPPVQNESRSAKKKKAKAEVPVTVPSAPSTTPSAEVGAGQAAAEPSTNGADGAFESPYIKELYKNIRNVKKKLNATQKVDSIIAENPGTSLDDLLSSRKINQDQKAQALKKPSLQASLAQLEEQIAQYKKFDEEYQDRLNAEKSALQSSHKDELLKVKELAVAETEIEAKKEANENMLVLSKFLRAAAAKRQSGDEKSVENQAFEGALLLVYGGDASAVAAIEKLIEGSDEKVPAVEKELGLLDFSYKQVRDAALEHAPYAAEEAWAEEVAQSEPVPPAAEEPSPPPPATDPTVAHAGLTEIDSAAEPLENGTSSHIETPTVPDASSIDAGAANAAAENNWGPELSASATSGPEGWVEVPRDPAETDTGLTATPGAMASTTSWAEEVTSEVGPASTQSMAPPALNGDSGFQEVHHGRGRGRGGFQGEHRGGYRAPSRQTDW